MSVLVQPSMGYISALSIPNPASNSGPLWHCWTRALVISIASRMVALYRLPGISLRCRMIPVVLVLLLPPVAGPRSDVEHFAMSPGAIPAYGCPLGSVASLRLLNVSSNVPELDRVKYVVETLRVENVAIREVLEHVVGSTKSKLMSVNSRLMNGLGQLRSIIGDVNHQDFNVAKEEIESLRQEAEISEFATIDRTIPAVYMRCDDIELDVSKLFDELRADYVETLRGLGEFLCEPHC